MTTLQDAVALARGERTGGGLDAARRRHRAGLAGQHGHHHPPRTGNEVLAFVTYGRVKLANLRTRPALAATFRSGWQWATVEDAPSWPGPTIRPAG